MPKVKSINRYAERHYVYETTTSDEKSKSTDYKLHILSPRAINEKYQNAEIICAGVEKLKISKDQNWEKMIQNMKDEVTERKVQMEWCTKLKNCIIVNK